MGLESAIYEQCPYDWEHVSQIYRKLPFEPTHEGVWYVQEDSKNIRFRRLGGYFQFIVGDSSTSLFAELLEMSPMVTIDDAEWTIEKHDEGAYLVRTDFTATFGPVAEQQRLDELLQPLGLWLENMGSWISGAAAFDKLDSESMLSACRRITLLEKWCLEANRRTTRMLNDYWGSVADDMSAQIAIDGEPDFQFDELIGKRRQPSSPLDD